MKKQPAICRKGIRKLLFKLESSLGSLKNAHLIFLSLLQFSLAQLYHNGIGMEKDLKMALSLYEVL